MSFSNPQPLTIASRVLSQATLATFRKPPYTLRGWKILDRWALNSPTKLKQIEQNDPIELMNRVLDQQTRETEVLTESLPNSEGMAEHEILAMQEIQTEL